MIGAGVGCLFLNTTPEKVYHTVLTSVVDKFFDGLYQSVDSNDTTIKLSTNIEIDNETIGQEIINYINKTTLSINQQMNFEKGQYFIKLDTDYNQNSLIDFELLVDANNETTYIYAKDYFDKYLDIEDVDYSVVRELFDEIKLYKKQNKNLPKILKQELKKLITEKDCYKKDGKFIFEVTEQELYDKIKTLLTNLKNNNEFLECYKNPDLVKDYFETIIEEMDFYEMGDELITFAIEKDLFSTDFKKLTVSYVSVTLEFTKDKNTTNYKILIDNKQLLDGYIKNTSSNNNQKTEFLINIPELGKVTLYYDVTVSKNASIITVDTSNVIKLSELSEQDMSDITTNFENSQLYELLSSFGFNNSFGEEEKPQYQGALFTNTYINIKDDFSINVPSAFYDESSNYEYQYEYRSGAGIFDTCSFELLSPLDYTPSDNFAQQLFNYYADEDSSSITSTTINNIDWKWFSYDNSFGKNYYYVTHIDDKVYLLKYEVEKDAGKNCETYRQQILNSITKK